MRMVILLIDSPNPPAPFPEREGGELGWTTSPLRFGEGQGRGNGLQRFHIETG